MPRVASSVTAAACTMFALSRTIESSSSVKQCSLWAILPFANTRRQPSSPPTSTYGPPDRTHSNSVLPANRMLAAIDRGLLLDAAARAVKRLPPSIIQSWASGEMHKSKCDRDRMPVSSVSGGDPLRHQVMELSPTWYAVQPLAQLAANRYCPVTTAPILRWMTVSRSLPDSSQTDAIALPSAGLPAIVATRSSWVRPIDWTLNPR